METVPVIRDEGAFDLVDDCEPLGLSSERLNRMLPDLVERATLLCVIGGKERPAHHGAVDLHEGALLRYRIAPDAAMMFLLHKGPQQMELVALWPQLNGGCRLIAEVTGLIVSPAGTQAHAHLLLPDLPEHSGLCVHLSEYAFTAGLPERGGTSRFHVTGLPMSLRRADMTPVRIGPDAPGYASMVAAGIRPDPQGALVIEQRGMAAFFSREDIAPNACEFRGTVTAIREGGDFFGTRFRLADVTVFRSDDGSVEHQISVVLSAAVWDDPAGPGIGDDIVGVALLQAAAVGAVRQNARRAPPRERC